MADFSAPQSRSAPRFSVVSMLLAIVMFVGCLGLAQLAGFTASPAQSVFISQVSEG